MKPNGVVDVNPQNRTEARHIHNYSTFDKSLSYMLANTLRFGEITPTFVMEGVEKDKISLNSLDKIDSLSLKAPFKGSIRKIKQSYKVPMMAILPNNWDRIYTQPSNGDDVPKDANCVLSNFPATASQFWLNLFSLVKSNIPTSTSTAADVSDWLTALVRMLVVGEYFYSNGSLLNVLGYKHSGLFSQFVSAHAGTDYDSFFDRIINYVFTPLNHFYFEVVESAGMTPTGYYVYGLGSNQYGRPEALSLRAMLDFFRENPFCYVDLGPANFDTNIVADLSAYITYLGKLVTLPDSTYPYFNTPVISSLSTHPASDDITDLHPSTLNLSRVLAYQLCCAHFLSNSSVDFIYTAELYRQYIFALSRRTNTTLAAKLIFTWNGYDCVYDHLSGRNIALSTIYNGNFGAYVFTYSDLCDHTFNNPGAVYRFGVLAAIFAYRRSLRYGDYFVGSRPRPLAPINTNVSVNNNEVSVIDVTRNIQAQRFANMVMRSRSKIEDYVESLFGKKPDPDFHNPFYLSEEVETIFGDEVQNVGAKQFSSDQSRTANFATAGVGRYTFTFENDDMHPCIYLQLVSFDVRRAYTRSVDRQFLHQDRYDMFNPDFQYIGDQPVYGIEIGSHPVGGTIPDVFAYQGRDAEYKQRFDVCSGGFCSDRLPGWLLTDKTTLLFSYAHLTPDFIRNFNCELDSLFLSLSGFSLGHYFHFTCVTHNNVSAKRAMAVDPQILA